jgi:hypothetical protein
MKLFISLLLLVAGVAHADDLRGVRLESIPGDTRVTMGVTDSSGFYYTTRFLASTLTGAQQTALNNFITFVNAQFVGGGETQGVITLSNTSQTAPASYGTSTRTFTDKQGNDYTDTYRTITLPLHDIIGIRFSTLKGSDKEKVNVAVSEMLPTVQRDRCIAIWNFCVTQAAGL